MEHARRRGVEPSDHRMDHRPPHATPSPELDASRRDRAPRGSLPSKDPPRRRRWM